MFLLCICLVHETPVEHIVASWHPSAQVSEVICVVHVGHINGCVFEQLVHITVVTYRDLDQIIIVPVLRGSVIVPFTDKVVLRVKNVCIGKRGFLFLGKLYFLVV